MAAFPAIRSISRASLDTAAWDACIDAAPNGLVYACSVYLDIMAPNWDALVLQDAAGTGFSAVMPLTWNKKYGIRYLHQPFLTAQLGVFGKQVDASLLQSFLQAIPEEYKYIDIYLNHANRLVVPGFPLYERVNYVLDLQKPYTDLRAAYRENIRRNVRKSSEAGCKAVQNVPVEQVVELAWMQMRNTGHAENENKDKFLKLYHTLAAAGKAMTYGVIGPNDQLLASCVFFFSHGRAYYILVGNHPNGKTIGASHALIDAFIRDHAEKDLLLDFEGSDIRNLAFFYSSFGAVEEKYAGLKVNRLPFFMKWMKK